MFSPRIVRRFIFNLYVITVAFCQLWISSLNDYWLIARLIEWLIDWSVDWLIDWLIDWSIDGSIDRLIDRLIDLPASDDLVRNFDGPQLPVHLELEFISGSHWPSAVDGSHGYAVGTAQVVEPVVRRTSYGECLHHSLASRPRVTRQDNSRPNDIGIIIIVIFGPLNWGLR